MNNEKDSSSAGALEVFNFSQSRQPVRVQLQDNEPWFVAKDVCDILGLTNSRMATQVLDEDEKRVSSAYTSTGMKIVSLVNESGLYHLIFQSRKPEAKKFRKWVTRDVLPSIRKKGYYWLKKSPVDYLDVRDVPYQLMIFRGGEVRVVYIDGEAWYSLNDIHSCIGSRTESTQTARRLNARQTLARKMWLHGVPNPGWFIKELGVRLLLCASHKNREDTQLMLDLNGKEE